jgi:hypothetical protein
MLFNVSINVGPDNATCASARLHCLNAVQIRLKGKVTAVSVQVCHRFREFQEVEAPRFQDSRRMKVVILSGLSTSRLYLSENIPGAHLC